MKTKSQHRLSRVRNALYAQPWAITPEWLEAICEIFERHVNAEKIEFDFEQKTKIGSSAGAPLFRGEYEIIDGVAIVPLMGPLFPRANLMTRMSGATSYEEFSAKFDDALGNKDVNAVLLQIDSPGGSVLGCFETAEKVFSSRDQGKPVVAVADNMAASAAYAIGSQAMEFYGTRGAIIGSIGVVMQIEDDTRQRENDGIRTHTLKSGPLKAIGAGPITDEQLQSLRAKLGEYFQTFKDGVSRARADSEIDIETVSTGETWIGPKAVSMGLVDGISTMDEQLARLA